MTLDLMPFTTPSAPSVIPLKKFIIVDASETYDNGAIRFDEDPRSCSWYNPVIKLQATTPGYDARPKHRYPAQVRRQTIMQTKRIVKLVYDINIYHCEVFVHHIVGQVK
jgi:hypothetical protein